MISDYNAVAELLNHGVAADLVEAAALALNAGVDIDMTSGAYVQSLPAALERGLVTMATIDASVRRVLELKERLGLFDDPYRRGSAPLDARRAAERRELARDAARRAIVLLSNRTGVLPLSPKIKRLAIIGPLAAAPGEMLGSWASAGKPEDVVSILEGLKAALPQCQIDHAAGVDIDGQETGRDTGRNKSVRRRRGYRALPWRERGDERGGGEPSRSSACLVASARSPKPYLTLASLSS